MLDNFRHHFNIAVFLSIYHRLSNNSYEFALIYISETSSGLTHSFAIHPIPSNMPSSNMPPKSEPEDSTATPADPEQAPNLATGGEDDASKETDSKKPAEGGSADATVGKEEDDTAAKARQRQERFKALQARAVSTLTGESQHWSYWSSLTNLGIEIRS